MEKTVVRSASDVERIEHPGTMIRRHVALEAGIGALRRFDDVTLERNARLSLAAHEGFDAVVYALAGDVVLEDDRGRVISLADGQAACARVADVARASLRSAGSSARARVLVVSVAASSDDPPPAPALAASWEDARGIAWVASHGGEVRRELGAHLGSSALVAVGTIDPGAEVSFDPVPDRALFLVALEGTFEVGPLLVAEGGDARCSLAKGVTIQGVTRARVAIADVPLGFAQRVA
jgi:hypothetical protein